MKKAITALTLLVYILTGCSTNSNNTGGSTTTVVPVAPSNLTGAVLSSSSVSLNWVDNSTNETGFKIERRLNGASQFTVVGTVNADVTIFTDTNLVANTSYEYRVYSFNAVGNSITYSNTIVLTTLAQAVIPTSLNNGLVAYYPFNTNANDSSGNGNHGAVNGAILTTDRFGNSDNAYYFSCNSIHSIINTSSITNAMTLSFWYYRSGSGCIGPRVMEFSQGSNQPGELIIEENFPTGLRIGHVTTAGLQNTLGWMHFNTLTNQVWSHYVYTNDGTIAKIYENGVLLNQYNSPGLPVLDGDVAFGWMNHPAYDGVNGKLDDIRIYNRALTQSEITYLATH